MIKVGFELAVSLSASCLLGTAEIGNIMPKLKLIKVSSKGSGFISGIDYYVIYCPNNQ
jgi:hypothetical protein